MKKISFEGVLEEVLNEFPESFVSKNETPGVVLRAEERVWGRISYIPSSDSLYLVHVKRSSHKNDEVYERRIKSVAKRIEEKHVKGFFSRLLRLEEKKFSKIIFVK